MSEPGEILRRLRRGRDLTQRQLGDLLGVTDSAVSEWERGSSTPSRTNALAADEAVAAGGAVLAAFGFADHQMSVGFDGELPDEISTLPTKVERLEAEVSRLDGLVNALALRLESALEDALKARQDSPAASKPKRAAPAARRSVG